MRATDDDARAFPTTTTTMRTSMTVGGAGATTEQELGELKVRSVPPKRASASRAMKDER